MYGVRVAAVGVHDVHVARGGQVAEAEERDLGAVRGPRPAEFFGRVGGEPGLAGAVGVHDVDVAVAGGVALVGDLAAVRAPVRQLIFGRRVGGELPRVRSVGVHHPHLEDAGAVAEEGDL